MKRSDFEKISKVHINICEVVGEIRRYIKEGNSFGEVSHEYARVRPGEKGYQKKGEKRIKIFKLTGRADELTMYDCAVTDAVYTLYHRITSFSGSSSKSFRAEEILRLLSGNPSQRLSDYRKKGAGQKSRKEELEESLDRLSAVFITIVENTFYVESKREYRIDEEAVVVCEDAPYIPVRKREDGDYEFIAGKSIPVYEYAIKKRKVITIPEELLGFCGRFSGVRNADGKTAGRLYQTAEAILINRYLIREIEIMRHPKAGGGRNSVDTPRSRVRFLHYYNEHTHKEEGLMPEVGVLRCDLDDKAWIKQRNRVLKTVTQILDSFRACRYIEDYMIQRNSKRGSYDVRAIMIIGKIKDPKEIEYQYYLKKRENKM